MSLLAHIGIIVGTFGLMEVFTWWLHKYVMHGILWIWHEDHHLPKSKGGFEKNDYFFVVFGFISMVVFLLGTLVPEWRILFFLACGITLYGCAYFFVHDVFIHQRIKWLRYSNHFYFRALRRAHKVHHKRTGKDHGACFGMLWVPLKYFREARADSNKQ